ncbi:uncharacterized protein MONBRDRAFT_24909 [Monosiga brevicollis MX1]|uniref:Aminotransferase class I/classII large domain-containing protein n=1 Tax=Monosiga brevicollis TaxID=81824 RepID=A9UY39_MONBE|nr:uncharacterized protein MONBRDRAFT_24909 [Monosiga brevicollis MX1]EDQ89794.1 predicted protein [Monosiga brevicollis MX1]|eukprot:XP_001745216.1 hypothetical protein [Monosiga brevicollis MX1]
MAASGSTVAVSVAGRLQRCSTKGSEQWARITALANREGVLNLGQGRPDGGGSQRARDALLDVLQHSSAEDLGNANQYSPVIGLPRLRQAVGRWTAVAQHLEYNPESEICITTSGTEALYCATQALINPGDHVIIFQPFFPWYLPHLQLAEANVEVLTLEPPDFALPLDRLKAAMTPDTKAIVINTPHNPTGRALTEAEGATVAQLCRDNDCLLITDEVYAHLLTERPHISLAALPGMRERTLVVGSASKLLALTGWRVAWVLGPAAMVKAIGGMHAYTTYAAPTPLQLAVAAAIESACDDQTDLKTEAALYDANYQALRAALERALKVQVHPRDGGYFLVAQIPDAARGVGFDYAVWLADHVGLACVPMGVFYGPTPPASAERLFRFTICKSAAYIQSAVAKLDAFAAQA